MFLGNEGRTALFNEIAAQLAPNEGKAYMDSFGRDAANNDVYLSSEIQSLAMNTALAVSTDLTRKFGNEGKPCDDQEVKDFYKAVRDHHEKHYDAHLNKGENLSNDQKSMNSAIQLHAAVSRTLIDKMVARLG
jgi:hypothetical protein